MQNKFLIRAVICFVSFSLLAGCAALEKKDTTNPALLEPQAMVKFTDVPVPSGFKFLPKSSYSFETQGVRVGMLKYQGKASPEQIVAFYKEQMAMCNWNLLNIIEYGERQLNFDRDSETCVITLTPRGGSTLVSIALGPKGQIMPKKETKPVK
jgi:nitrous oxide reductase accessory protein NosL